jgi:hypothetical protein
MQNKNQQNMYNNSSDRAHFIAVWNIVFLLASHLDGQNKLQKVFIASNTI